ncbi:NADH-cytochrome b5 reductase-like isoform X2 [Pecten maximus]|uniref:NADH-cytochrome b5 reductase-like isoform X2 n=1 Tax=Pecten maximus TaxID=6579 RepID=UPI001458519C|nr:NADH-cytochrome b5 reductase-like isoform X2 [Pecten maximus]
MKGNEKHKISMECETIVSDCDVRVAEDAVQSAPRNAGDSRDDNNLQLLLQAPNIALNSDLHQPPEKPLDSDLFPQPLQKLLDSDLPPLPPEELHDNDLQQPQEKPLDKELSDLPLPLEKPLDSDLFPPPPEKPVDGDLLPQPPEKPLDRNFLPKLPEKPLDSNLHQPLEKPLDSDPYPQPPEKPLDSDCCGTGCVPCVFDIHMQEMKIWEKECRRIRQRLECGNADGQDDSVKILSETEYHQFTIASITTITKDTRLYRFHLPTNRSLGLKLGQHLIIRGLVDGNVVTRQYTPVSDVKVTDYFELLIKHERILMLAAGSGIAPMVQIIQGVLNNEEDETRIQLLYACRTYSDILMKSQLDEWAEFWNFSVLYILSQEPSGVKTNYRYKDKIHLGRLDKDLLVNEIQTPVVSRTKFLISGTKSFDKDMLKYCKILGILDCDIHKF